MSLENLYIYGMILLVMCCRQVDINDCVHIIIDNVWLLLQVVCSCERVVIDQ